MEQSTVTPILLTTLTLGITLLYFLLQPRGEETQSPREFQPYSPLGHYERCKFEYEAFSEGVRSRDHYTMITGSIIVSACALILVQSLVFAEYRVLIVFTALVLFSLWLPCYYCTTRRADNESYERLRMLERSLGLQISLYLRPRTRETTWHFFREHFWLLVFWVLSILGLALLL